MLLMDIETWPYTNCIQGQSPNSNRQDRCMSGPIFDTIFLDESVLIANQAAAEGISLHQSLVVPRKNINKATYQVRFPLSQGKIPGLEGPGIKLTETIAIAYVS